MRQPASFSSPVSAAIRHVDYFRVARNTGGALTGVVSAMRRRLILVVD